MRRYVAALELPRLLDFALLRVLRLLRGALRAVNQVLRGDRHLHLIRVLGQGEHPSHILQAARGYMHLLGEGQTLLLLTYLLSHDAA